LIVTIGFLIYLAQVLCAVASTSESIKKSPLKISELSMSKEG